MKNNTLSGLAVLLLTVINGCTRESDPGLGPTLSQGISVFGNTQDETGTKSTINNGIETHWVGGTDKIGIFSPQATTAQEGSTPANNVAFTAQSSAKLSAFAGTMYWGSTSTDHTFYAYYPCNSGYGGDQTAVPINLSANQIQAQTGNSDHIGALDYMIASSVTVSSPAEAGEVGGSVNLSFHHVFSMIEFQIKGSGSLSQVNLIGTDPLSFSSGTIDLTQTPGADAYTITKSGTSNYASVKLGTPVSLSSETAVSIYMMVLPGTHSKKMEIALKIDGNWKTMSKEPPGGFMRGKKYVISLNSGDEGWYGTLTDSRDSNTYGIVVIGSQIWMDKNLAFLPEVSPANTGSSTGPYYYVYDYNGTDVTVAKTTGNYSTYGVLYNWPAVMAGSSSSGSNPSGVQGICPDGWHLPSEAEWTQLSDCLGGGSVAGGKLKYTSTVYWNSPNAGATNESGFTAFPGGCRYDGTFYFGRDFAYWWSSTDPGTDYARSANVSTWDGVLTIGGSAEDMGLSVRCLKDKTEKPGTGSISSWVPD